MFLVSTKELRPSGAPGGRAHEFTVLGATANGGAICLAAGRARVLDCGLRTAVVLACLACISAAAF